MLKELMLCFAQQAEQELLLIRRDFTPAKQEEGPEIGRGTVLSTFVRVVKEEKEHSLGGWWWFSNKRAWQGLDSALIGHCSLDTSARNALKKWLQRWTAQFNDLGLLVNVFCEKEPTRYGSIYDESNKLFQSLLGLRLETAADSEYWYPTKKGCKVLVKQDTLTKPDKLEPRASTGTRRPTDRMCLYIDAEEHELGDLENRAIRILIAIAAYYDYEIWQMDVKTTFLNGYLNEEVYMEQPEGYPKKTIGYSFYYLPENKVFVARNTEFFENDIINQKASESLKDLEIIQEEDTHPSIDTSLNHEEDDLEMDEPQSDIIPIRRSTRTRRPTDRMCLYIDAEEHQLWVLLYDLYWNTVKNILKYIRNTNDMFLVYGGAVDWKSAKQSIFATSSEEAEYIAAYDASKEVVWVRKFISGLGVVPRIE
ncbi:zinc finger, CCHC-type containing protein, partial [Tanacetum coccineum]